MRVDTYGEPERAEPAGRAALPLLKPVPIRRRLILLVAGATLPLFLLSVLVALIEAGHARDQASERVLQTTRGAMASVERELDNIFAALDVLASSPVLERGDFAAFDDEARRFLARYPNSSGLSLTDATGQQVYNSFLPRGSPLPARFDRETADTVFATGTRRVSNIYISPALNRRTLTLDIPVMRDGKVLYDMAFIPQPGIFFDVLAKLNLPEGWIVSIFDRNAHHVARKPALPTADITSAAESLRAELGVGNDRILPTTSLEGIEMLTAFSRSGTYGWAVAIGMPFEVIDGPTRRSLAFSLGTGALFILIAMAFAGRFATQMVRAEAHRELLLNELNHRAKNMLSAVQAIVAQSLGKSSDPLVARRAIETRLMALAQAHNMLSSRNWEAVDLEELARAIVEPYAGATRVRFSGPSVRLVPRVAISFALMVNELATNATKYGALSGSEGLVEVTWTRLSAHRLRLMWTESGGPSAGLPGSPGFGTRLITRVAEQELAGSYQAAYEPTGLRCTVEIGL